MLIFVPKHGIQWFVPIGYFVAATLLHLKVSELLVEPLPFFPEKLVLLNYFSSISVFTLGVLTVFILKQSRRGTRRLVTWGYWGLLAVTAFIADKYLLFKNIEYIHYPQYAGLAFLVASRMDPERQKFCVGRIVFWTTLLGMADEMFQYFYLCASYGHYLDFNDFFLNLQGAFAGTLIYYGFHPVPTKRQKRPKALFRSAEVIFLTAFIVGILFLARSGRLMISPPDRISPGSMEVVDGKRVIFLERKPGIFGTWNAGVHRGGDYYVLTPVQGLCLLVLAGTLFASFGISMKCSRS